MRGCGRRASASSSAACSSRGPPPHLAPRICTPRRRRPASASRSPRSTTRCTSSPRPGCCARSRSTARRTYFDTNVSDHHHFFVEGEGRLIDMRGGVGIDRLPEPPEGMEITPSRWSSASAASAARQRSPSRRPPVRCGVRSGAAATDRLSDRASQLASTPRTAPSG